MTALRDWKEIEKLRREQLQDMRTDAPATKRKAGPPPAEAEELAPEHPMRRPALFANCQVVMRTERSIKVRREGWAQPQWFPFSLIKESSDLDSRSEVGSTGTLVVTRWIAWQKGWWYFG